MIHMDHGRGTINKETTSLMRFLNVCFENKRNFNIQDKKYTQLQLMKKKP